MMAGARWLIFCTAVLLTACSGQRVMMPTPNVYNEADTEIYANLHPELKSTEVPLFYVTDRQPEQDENGNLKYGYDRSNSLAFGSTVVDLGQDISWEQLLEASRIQQRLDSVPLELTQLKEIHPELCQIIASVFRCDSATRRRRHLHSTYKGFSVTS
jgi:esterase/lipase superfamily enzyme